MNMNRKSLQCLEDAILSHCDRLGIFALFESRGVVSQVTNVCKVSLINCPTSTSFIIEEECELPKVLIKVLFWALLKVFLLGKVLFKVLKKVPKKV